MKTAKKVINYVDPQHDLLFDFQLISYSSLNYIYMLVKNGMFKKN